MFYSFVTKHACDGRTDTRTELRSQDRASIAASRGKTAFDDNNFDIILNDRVVKNNHRHHGWAH